ncbi:MAG: extensin family protein, partial [Rhodobacteraceae bacterium]|nr:extensin family protein [Paracoccaceae bacterium]
RPLPAAAAPAAPAAPAPAAPAGAVPAAEGAAAPADPAAAAAVAASVAPPAAGVEEAVAAAIHAPTRGDATAAEPAAVAVAVPPAAPLPVGPALRPRPRPATAAVEVTRAAIAPALSPLAVLSSARPRARPAVLRRPPRAAAAAPPVVQASAAAAGVRVQPDPAAIVGRPGALCGTDGLQGRALPPVASSVRGCGIANPVRLTSVAGVALSPNPVLDCDTARALHRWVTIAARPAVGGTGGGIAELTIGSHYACRPRNNRPGARISEHGRGRAIDIMTIRLKDGQVMNVLRDFRSGPFSAPLKAMHRAACGIFGTTLGPGSDRYHENHFHYDTARHRSGAYCR